MKKHGHRRSDEKAPEKPWKPMPIHSQLCYGCGAKLEHGMLAIAHMVNPVAWCVPCMGEKEKSHPSLCRAVVLEPKEDPKDAAQQKQQP